MRPWRQRRHTVTSAKRAPGLLPAHKPDLARNCLLSATQSGPSVPASVSPGAPSPLAAWPQELFESQGLRVRTFWGGWCIGASYRPIICWLIYLCVITWKLKHSPRNRTSLQLKLQLHKNMEVAIEQPHCWQLELHALAARWAHAHLAHLGGFGKMRRCSLHPRLPPRTQAKGQDHQCMQGGVVEASRDERLAVQPSMLQAGGFATDSWRSGVTCRVSALAPPAAERWLAYALRRRSTQANNSAPPPSPPIGH